MRVPIQIDADTEVPEVGLDDSLLAQAKAAGMELGPMQDKIFDNDEPNGPRGVGALADQLVEQKPNDIQLPLSGPDPVIPQEAQSKDRPSWLPEKFKTPEDFAKSYAELEKRLGKPDEAEPSQDQVVQPTQTVFTEDSIKKYTTEFETSGKLSDESMQSLSKVLPKEYIDQYLSGLQAQKQLQEVARGQLIASVVSEVGGEKTVQAAVEWGRASLDPKTKEAFNKAMQGDESSVRLALSGLISQYRAAEGQRGNLVHGRTGSLDTYESWDQVTEDMKNPKYHSDPAFRNRVLAKMQRSGVPEAV